MITKQELANFLGINIQDLNADDDSVSLLMEKEGQTNVSYTGKAHITSNVHEIESSEFNIKKLKEIIEKLTENLKHGESGTPYLNPMFIKVFEKEVPQNYIKSGWDIAKGYFKTSLPSLIATKYGGFWFYVSYRSIKELRMLVEARVTNDLSIGRTNASDRIVALTNLIYDLNNLYVLIFFNSLIRKHVPYNFDYNLWNVAVEKSKAKYMKNGLEYIMKTFGESITEKMVRGKYFTMGTGNNNEKQPSIQNILPLIKAYYELRHRTSQVVKPVMIVYYKLLELKKSTYRSEADTLLQHDVDTPAIRLLKMWWNYMYETEHEYKLMKSFVLTYIAKRNPPKACAKDILSHMFDICKNISFDNVDFILKNLIRGVWDINFWRQDPIIQNIFKSYLKTLDYSKENITCLLKVLYTIYIYITKEKGDKLNQQGGNMGLLESMIVDRLL